MGKNNKNVFLITTVLSIIGLSIFLPLAIASTLSFRVENSLFSTSIPPINATTTYNVPGGNTISTTTAAPAQNSITSTTPATTAATTAVTSLAVNPTSSVGYGQQAAGGSGATTAIIVVVVIIVIAAAYFMMKKKK